MTLSCGRALCSDESEQAEAVLMLTAILHFESDDSASRHPGPPDDEDDANNAAAAAAGDRMNESSEAVARVYHCLAMLYYLLRNDDKVMFS